MEESVRTVFERSNSDRDLLNYRSIKVFVIYVISNSLGAVVNVADRFMHQKWATHTLSVLVHVQCTNAGGPDVND